jgi:hypothetical protein
MLPYYLKETYMTPIDTVISSLPSPYNTITPLPNHLIAYIPLVRTYGSLYIPYNSTTDRQESRNAIVLKVGSDITNISPGDAIIPSPTQGILLTETSDIRLLRYDYKDVIAVVTE